VLVSALSAMFVDATDPNLPTHPVHVLDTDYRIVDATDPDLPIRTVRELDTDYHIGQVQGFFRLNRQSQGEICEKASTALETPFIKLDKQTGAALEKCGNASCNVNYASYSAFTKYKNACIAAKGALATYKATINCGTIVFVFTNFPVCMTSAKVNAICRPKALEEDVTYFFDLDECTETAINTGYTDFYASTPVQKPVTKPVKQPAKRAVRRALAAD
jgi:hypothetical protein